MKLTYYLWTLPFFSFLTGYLLLQRITNVDQIQAPALVGKQLQSAIATLSEKNLNLRFIAQKEDPDLPHGTILSQTPLAGRNVKPHQAIHIVISKKPEKIVAPMLLNKSVAAIEKELSLAGVRNKFYPVASKKPTNSCIAQFPAPGTPLEENKLVTYLSAGHKKPLLMPSFQGKSLDVVKEFLSRYNVQIEVQKSGPGDTIANQRPLAGSFVNFDPRKPLFVQLQTR